MTKSTGLGDNLYIAGYNISGDVGSVESIGGGPALLEVTGIASSGVQRVGGQRTGGIAFTSYFNDATSQEHDALSSLPTTDVGVMYFRGTTLGNAAAATVAKQVNYDGTRSADGSLTFAVDTQSNDYGLEWGVQLTAGVRTDTGATNGTGVDGGAGTSNGLQAYLQVFDFTGTDITIKLQGSSDDGASDAYADLTGAAFTQITSGDQHHERIATATNLSVERYVRAVSVTTGGFTTCSFAVMFRRNTEVPVF